MLLVLNFQQEDINMTEFIKNKNENYNLRNQDYLEDNCRDIEYTEYLAVSSEGQFFVREFLHTNRFIQQKLICAIPVIFDFYNHNILIFYN